MMDCWRGKYLENDEKNSLLYGVLDSLTSWKENF